MGRMGQLQTRGEGDDDDELGEAFGVTISGLEELETDTDELVYELDGWADDARVLRDRLELLGVPHQWEGSSLVVSSADEAWVERVLDQVEDDLAQQVDPSIEQVAYDLSGWDEPLREALLDLLAEESVPHGLEGDELFVHEIDEQRVDEMVDAVLDPDRPSRSATGGLEVMGELFVAADRLRRDPADQDGIRSLGEAASGASAAAPPYGMDRAWWGGTVPAETALVALIDSDPEEGDEVGARAAELRDRLRPYV
jgi:hypothetical protein